MKKLTISILALVLMLGGVVLTAQAGHHEGKSDGKCPMMKGDCCKKGGSECPIVSKLMKKAGFYLENADAIGLTEDQVSQIEAIKSAAKKEMILAGAQMEVAMMDMGAKLKTDPVDVEGLNQMIDANLAGMSAGAKKAVQQYADLKQVLNADQKKKAKEVWKNAEKK
ncbi:MAG TPA: Spy/CpxP family protein refolding chaperone [Candidatus Omnitrophota bacterium]|nr:Spy/CpxP family protein refolding chaperone [Candidatus Omnitrophota bacterium]